MPDVFQQLGPDQSKPEPPARGAPPSESHLGYVLGRNARDFPDRVAVAGPQGTVTYRELDLGADAVAEMLVRLQVRPGDRVALLWNNHVLYPQCLLGVMRTGAVAVPLNPKLSDTVLDFILRDTKAVAVLAGPGLIARGSSLAAACGGYATDVGEAFPCDSRYEPPGLQPGSICMQPYTAGSTGLPKGVPLTHEGQIWNVDSVRAALTVTEDDRALVVTPMFHANAGITMLVLLRAGGQLVVMPQFDADRAVAAIAEYRCTMLIAVPAIFRALIGARERFPDLKVDSLEVARAGSATVPLDLPEAFERAFGVPLGEGYGLTEGGPYVTISPRLHPSPLGTAGLPVPDGEVEVRDGDNKPVAAGQRGQLWVRNPGVTPGYHNLPELTASRLEDGWLATGDVAEIDERGFVRIAGRLDDRLNVGGENVYPKEVEQVLLAHPDVREVAIVSVPHAIKGEVPAALVVATSGAALEGDALKQFFLERGPAYAHPRVIALADAIPLLATGKPDRAAIRTIVEEHM